MNRLIALVTATSAMLLGCGSLDYKAPSDRPLARLTVRNAEGPGGIVLNAFQKVDCRDAGKYVPDTTLRPGAEATVNIEADRPFSFRVQAKRPVTPANANVVGRGDTTISLNVCDAAGTFSPKAGGRYTAVFTDSGNICKVVVLDAGSTAIVDGYVQKKWVLPTLTEGWRCSPT